MPLLPPKPRVKLAALSLAGALIVALPTVQVLRYQGHELQAAQAARAGLDPLMRATALQRALLAHRDASREVLRGHEEREPQRRVHQGEVDDRAEALAAAVAMLAPPAAIDETNELRDDWATLVRRIAARSISDGDSDDGHRLLVEQTLQVIDLVVDPLLGAADAAAALMVAALQARQAALEALAVAEEGAGLAPAAQRLERAAQTQAALAATLQRRQDDLQRQRAALLLAMALLGAAAAALAASLRRRPAVQRAPTDPSTPGSGASDRAEAQRLLHRLRRDSACGLPAEDAPREPLPSRY
ncbi:MAG: hypothetical protein KF863_08770 [Rubrivivax sp.]|nr:hypothetical protein [Rubrivivax sp.]